MKLSGVYLFNLIVTALLLQGTATAQVHQEVLELMSRGRYPAAEQLVAQASAGDVFAARLGLELALRRGETDAAESYAGRILSLYHSGDLKDAEQIAQAAYASWQLDRWQEANQIYMEVSRMGTTPLPVMVDWGHLYLEKYNAAEAESIFQETLSGEPSDPIFPRWGLDTVHLGLARALSEQHKPGASDALAIAEQINPGNPDLFVFKARRAIIEERWEDSTTLLEKGLAANREYVPLLELEGALLHFLDRKEQYEQIRSRIFQINPRNAHFYELLGDLSIQKRRLEESIGFYREAIRLNPRQWSALSSLGINLLRLGQEEEGLQHLERAYQNDPFNIWTVNTLRLLDSFDQFEMFETEHFRVRLNQREAAALRPYVEELLERSISTLKEKYGAEIEGKFGFEMYPDHEDFAVRTLGLPGLGALGAVIGRIVAMDSPSARPKGRFHWGSTLWHEVAHVVTLSLSNYRVPRWLTEGLSMMEERRAAPGWGESVSPGFVRAFRDRQLLSLEDLNSGFVMPESPQQLEFSYLQAGLVCDFLAENYGFEKIRSMLSAYAQGRTSEQVFREVLEQSKTEVDRQFNAFLEKEIGPLVLRLDTSFRREWTPGAAPSLEQIQALLEKAPENHFLNLEMGRRLKEKGNLEEARYYLDEAIRLFPQSAGRESAYPILIELQEDLGDREAAMDTLRLWWEQAPHLAENAFRLASWLSEAGRPEEAIEHLEQAVYADPLDPTIHRLLGDLYLEMDEPQKAIREFQVLLSLAPPDQAGARYRLAKAFFLVGDRETARRQVLLALEIAPGYPEAQQLLLQMVRQ